MHNRNKMCKLQRSAFYYSQSGSPFGKQVNLTCTWAPFHDSTGLVLSMVIATCPPLYFLSNHLDFICALSVQKLNQVISNFIVWSMKMTIFNWSVYFKIWTATVGTQVCSMNAAVGNLGKLLQDRETSPYPKICGFEVFTAGNLSQNLNTSNSFTFLMNQITQNWLCRNPESRTHTKCLCLKPTGKMFLKLATSIWIDFCTI